LFIVSIIIAFTHNEASPNKLKEQVATFMTSKEQVMAKINQHGPKFISLLGGKLVDFDIEKDACTFEFNISKDYCHSIDVVQGGFVTAMLDATMSHAVMAMNQDISNISSLEIKTTYLQPTRAGKLRVEGWAIKKGYKIAFMEGHIYDENNVLTATASSVAKLARAPK
jgi:uncharacterized protein (TIGR00369 family)|tara:strand:+ start:1300 stop:1803 length:504 start_codon:yes stop_codon:yes gene_type:complete